MAGLVSKIWHKSRILILAVVVNGECASESSVVVVSCLFVPVVDKK